MAIDFEVTPGVIEAIERATLQAVRPDVVDTSIPGWLLPMDGGTVGRAHSAVPLAHPQDASAQAAQTTQLPHIAQRYRANGLPPVFRLPEEATWLHDAARALGAERVEPTWVMTVPMSKLLQLRPLAYAGNVHISVERLPDPAWQALFTGEGLDPVDGAHRVRLLSRAEQTLFVTASLGDDAVACGAASFGHGWMGVHGMRTAAAHRGHGHAAVCCKPWRPMPEAAYGHLIPRMSSQRRLVFSTHFCRWVPPTRLPWRCTAAPALYRPGVTPTGAVSKRSWPG
jgi:hypothetical protein